MVSHAPKMKGKVGGWPTHSRRLRMSGITMLPASQRVSTPSGVLFDFRCMPPSTPLIRTERG